MGNGLERNQNGGSGIRAIFALPALAGKFGVPGGGLVNGAGFVFPKTPAKLQRPDLVPPGTRTLNIVDVGAHLLDPDAVAAASRRCSSTTTTRSSCTRTRTACAAGLAREDLFTVGCDVVMTDSLRLLPTWCCRPRSHFEYHDLYAAYGQHWLQRAEPVIPPQGESLPNTEIFRRLAARFGFTDAAFTASDAELMDDAIDRGRPAPGRRAAEPASHRPRAAP